MESRVEIVNKMRLMFTIMSFKRKKSSLTVPAHLLFHSFFFLWENSFAILLHYGRKYSLWNFMKMVGTHTSIVYCWSGLSTRLAKQFIIDIKKFLLRKLFKNEEKKKNVSISIEFLLISFVWCLLLSKNSRDVVKTFWMCFT